MIRLLLVLLALLPTPALAQVPNREVRFVYGINVFTGAEYQGTFAPPSVDTIYVLANTRAVLDPKRTELYFWPITNEYRPDFNALNELVPGRLEVDGRPIELADYILQFDRAAEIGNGRISIGDEAHQHRAEFARERAAYLERIRAHADATEAFNRAVDEARQRGTTPPAAPEPPAPFTLFSGDIGRGFPLDLPPGEYRIQLRGAEGQVVPDSQKRLVAIAPRRVGVGYEVVPQDRWTFPERADGPSNVLYALPGSVVYLRPFAAIEVNAQEHARLQNPQDLAAAANRWIWVQSGSIEGTTLVAGAEPLAQAEYLVEQLPGGSLGYTVVPRRPNDRSPDLTAFRVEAPVGRVSVPLRLVRGSEELPGSRRELRATAGAADWQLFLPILVPLALGVTVALWRRERVITARALTPEQRRQMA